MSGNPTCLILTVGTGTQGKYSNLAQGLANTIQISRPARFWLVPSSSPDSIAVAALILDGLEPALREHFQPWSPERAYLEIEDHDNLEVARKRITEVILRAREAFPDLPIIVNPTSGTKQMSAGATLAALDEVVRGIEFTTGKRADGVVITGTETITPFDPGRWLAEKDATLAADLWNSTLHTAAAEVFVGNKPLLELALVYARLVFQKDNRNLQKSFESHCKRIDYLEYFIRVVERLQRPKLSHAVVDKPTRHMEFSVE